MKNSFFIFCFLCCIVASVAAQDVITLTNADEIRARVESIGEDEITYHKWEMLNGPIYTIKRDKVFFIVFENGYKEIFTEIKTTEDNQVTSTVANKYIYRTGGTFMVGSTPMNYAEYEKFLEEYCPEAFNVYENGLRLSNLGWSLFGSGIALDFAGAIITVVQMRRGRTTKAGTIIGLAGGALEIASIPILCVGFSRMKNRSVDIYNATCVRETAQLEFNTIVTTDGVGLAVKF